MRFFWTAIIPLVLFPVIYFVLYWSDKSFRDGAIGNWFGTVVGVIAGVPVGVTLARAQQNAQAEADRSKESFMRQERLSSIKFRVLEELQHNSGLVGSLANVLSKSHTARSDLWGWAAQVVNAVESEAYRELDAMILPEERGHFGAVAVGYLDLRRLVFRVRESMAAHDFLMGFSADEGKANFRLDEARAHTNIVRSELAHAIEELSPRPH